MALSTKVILSHALKATHLVVRLSMALRQKLCGLSTAGNIVTGCLVPVVNSRK